jgi:hypothetical protein
MKYFVQRMLFHVKPYTANRMPYAAKCTPSLTIRYTRLKSVKSALVCRKSFLFGSELPYIGIVREKIKKP